MKFVDEFRDNRRALELKKGIHQLASQLPKRERPLQLMEFCGGHTHTIFRYAIEQMLPDNIEMVHGPGCPVCVLPMERVDRCVNIARRPEVIFCTFGDAMRVPGSNGSLLQAKAEGADIRMVYSPLDALALARANPERQVVFFGLGFETTSPSSAFTVLQAESLGLNNFSLLCNHIATAPTIRAVLDAPDVQVEGFVAPGHVSMVIGSHPYQFIVDQYQRPLVIAGFEPLDIMQSIWMLLQQFVDGRCAVENQYTRVVRDDGNAQALAALDKVFEPSESTELRGLGALENAGLQITNAYAHFDAERRFEASTESTQAPACGQCGSVVRGVIKPWQCEAFGQSCTPDNPIGALMVSSEGACAAYYNYGDLQELLARRDHAPEAQPA
ncbi:MAG: hydrogenase formation protein HypD [Granulosicoccaceae bacterium]